MKRDKLSEEEILARLGYGDDQDEPSVHEDVSNALTFSCSSSLLINRLRRVGCEVHHQGLQTGTMIELSLVVILAVLLKDTFRSALRVLSYLITYLSFCNSILLFNLHVPVTSLRSSTVVDLEVDESPRFAFILSFRVSLSLEPSTDIEKVLHLLTKLYSAAYSFLPFLKIAHKPLIPSIP